MYMDKNNKNKTYLSLLEDSLIKKNQVLDQILDLTQEQEQLIKEEDMDDDKFDKIIEEKDPLINKVVELLRKYMTVLRKSLLVIRINIMKRYKACKG